MEQLQAAALRNVCFKVSKYGGNPAFYETLRRLFLDDASLHRRFVPDFVVACDSPKAVRLHLSSLFPSDWETGVYKRRLRYLEDVFADLIFYSERDMLSAAEVDALSLIDVRDRSSMDRITRLAREGADRDPRRSLILSRHAILELAAYLLGEYGLPFETKAKLVDLFEQIKLAIKLPVKASVSGVTPDRHFIMILVPLMAYIDKWNSYYSWEEGNRKPDRPTVKIARQFCEVALLLCQVLWQLIIESA